MQGFTEDLIAQGRAIFLLISGTIVFTRSPPLVISKPTQSTWSVDLSSVCQRVRGA